MQVDLRLKGISSRVLTTAFEGYSVTTVGTDTIVSGYAADEAEALGLIDRATSVGFSVLEWRVDPAVRPHDGELPSKG